MSLSSISLIVGLTLGVLALASTLLPWVIAERVNPIVETRAGAVDVGRYHALTGINLMMGTNRVDEIALVFAGAMISVLHIPLITLLEEKGPSKKKAFLFLLCGSCIVYPVALAYGHGVGIILRVDGVLGFEAMFNSPGLGFLIAARISTGWS